MPRFLFINCIFNDWIDKIHGHIIFIMTDGLARVLRRGEQSFLFPAVIYDVKSHN